MPEGQDDFIARLKRYEDFLKQQILESDRLYREHHQGIVSELQRINLEYITPFTLDDVHDLHQKARGCSSTVNDYSQALMRLYGSFPELRPTDEDNVLLGLHISFPGSSFEEERPKPDVG